MNNKIKLFIAAFLTVFIFVVLFVLKMNDSSLPWYISRASGIVSYLFLFLIMMSGIMITTKTMYRFLSPSTAWTMHQYIGITLTISIVAHVVSLLFDNFLKFSIADLFVPFASGFASNYIAMGIIGFYLFLAVIISSLFYKMKAPKIWRLLHYLPYPVFILIFIHGINIGSDTQTSTMQIVYWTTGTIMLTMAIYRIFYSPVEK